MSYLRTAPGAERESVLAARLGRRWDRILDRGHRLAIAAAARPYRATGAILLLNAALIAVFILVGDLLFSDPAELFRELMPGTWLSFAELLFVAVIAWSIQLAARGERRIRLDNFWGLTAAVFAVFAFDEITQLTVFLSDALTSLGALHPTGSAISTRSCSPSCSSRRRRECSATSAICSRIERRSRFWESESCWAWHRRRSTRCLPRQAASSSPRRA